MLCQYEMEVANKVMDIKILDHYTNQSCSIKRFKISNKMSVVRSWSHNNAKCFH